MKKLAAMTSLLILLTGNALAVDCSTMNSDDSRKLCKMNKRILSLLRSQGGGGGSTQEIGILKFYYDDGACREGTVIGRVYVTSSYEINDQACQRAMATKKVWGIGYEGNDGERICMNIKDTDDATVACQVGMRSIGR